jgi:hypothetical protein
VRKKVHNEKSRKRGINMENCGLEMISQTVGGGWNNPIYLQERKYIHVAKSEFCGFRSKVVALLVKYLESMKKGRQESIREKGDDE